ncbi:MAG: FimB/Mfa2 family fimbrial subunit, partial [Tannerellaceae bacterium]|nr:FimB/Mfa2 family fimbrial subunit [Tannerellaceae bacterium]
MKQYPHAALLLLFCLCLPSCINEDLSMCAWPDNLVLEFRLQTPTGASANETLNSVDALLFDGQGLFVDRQRLEREDLEAFLGARFSVNPGDYVVLAWANIASGSRLSELVPGKSRIEEGFVEMQAAGDSLYYAPAKSNAYVGDGALRAESDEAEPADPYTLHRVHVPFGGGQVVKEMPFTRAYRSVNIYVKGAENLRTASPADSNTPSNLLSVEASNLATGYDLLFNTISSKRRNATRA